MKLTDAAITKLSGQRVFVRADLNISFSQDSVESLSRSWRFQSLLPTLDRLLSHECKIILATHLGRPSLSNKGFFCDRIDESLSTAQLLPLFYHEGYAIELEQDLLDAQSKSEQEPDKILLLENLRFFKGEREHNLDFAHLLASLADVYVNEAFSLLHREDSSVTLLPASFPEHRRFMGLSFAKEAEQLDLFKKNKARPYLLLLGGKKAADKLGWLCKLLEQPNELLIPDQIVIMGQLSAPFILLENNKFIPDDLLAQIVTPELLEKAKAIKKLCTEKKRELLLGNKKVDPLKPEQEHKSIIYSHPLDCDRSSLEIISSKIMQAKKIVCAGTPGTFEQSESSYGSMQLFKLLSESSAYTIIGGGDTTTALELFGKPEQIDFISTGGGALLAYLASSNPAQEYESIKLIASNQ